MFVKETRSLVEKQLEDRLKASVPRNRDDRDPNTRINDTERRTAFIDWSHSKFPFSTDKGSLDNLILALNGRANVRAALPSASEVSISYTTLAKSILVYARPGTTLPHPKAPFQSGSRFLVVLRIAYKYIQSSIEELSSRSPTGAEATFVAFAVTVLRAHNIHFLPWHPPRIPRTPDTPHPPGAPSTKPSIDHWITITHSEAGFLDNNDCLAHTNDLELIAVSQLLRDQRNDGPWSIASVKAFNIGSLASKTVTPTEFIYSQQNCGGKRVHDSSSIGKHYTWCQQNARMSDKAHRFIIIAAILVTHLCPDIFIDTRANGPWPNPINTSHVTRTLQQAPFLRKPDRGTTQAGPMFSAFATQVLGMTEKSSPLGKLYFQKNTLPQEWSKKHSASPSPFIPSLSLSLLLFFFIHIDPSPSAHHHSLSFPSFPGMKGIHGSLLVRFSLGESTEFPNKNSAFTVGKFWPYTKPQLVLRCERFEALMASTDSYHEFFAVASITGIRIARHIAPTLGYSPAPVGYVRRLLSPDPSTSIQHHPPIELSDSDDNPDPMDQSL